MNPWDITAWVGAICVSIVTIAATVAALTALSRPKDSAGKSIFRGK